MKIHTRLTTNHIDLEVDEEETTIYKNSNEPRETIENLLSVVEDIATLIDETVFEVIEKKFNVKITKK